MLLVVGYACTSITENFVKKILLYFFLCIVFLSVLVNMGKGMWLKKIKGNVEYHQRAERHTFVCKDQVVGCTI